MLEWLRQNMRDMNRTVKWVMKKKTSQVNEREQGRGQLRRSGWCVWEVDGEVETTGIQSQTCKWNWTEGTELREREVYHLKMPWSRKEFEKRWHSEETGRTGVQSAGETVAGDKNGEDWVKVWLWNIFSVQRETSKGLKSGCGVTIVTLKK